MRWFDICFDYKINLFLMYVSECDINLMLDNNIMLKV